MPTAFLVDNPVTAWWRFSCASPLVCHWWLCILFAFPLDTSLLTTEWWPETSATAGQQVPFAHLGEPPLAYWASAPTALRRAWAVVRMQTVCKSQKKSGRFTNQTPWYFSVGERMPSQYWLPKKYVVQVNTNSHVLWVIYKCFWGYTLIYQLIGYKGYRTFFLY